MNVKEKSEKIAQLVGRLENMREALKSIDGYGSIGHFNLHMFCDRQIRDVVTREELDKIATEGVRTALAWRLGDIQRELVALGVMSHQGEWL